MSKGTTTCECGAPKTAPAYHCKLCAMRITGAKRRFLNHNCIDCDARISKGCKRCRPCRFAYNVGPNNSRWRGGRYIGQNGYMYVNGRYLKDTRFAQRHQIAEHTIVMEAMLGREMRKGESVHHKNGIRHDNRPENLELWVKPQPAGQRAEDVLAWAHEFIAMYERDVRHLIESAEAVETLKPHLDDPVAALAALKQVMA